MRELQLNEVQAISAGAHLRPSEWMFSAAGGALVGTCAYTITAFSAHPLGAAAIAIGAVMAITLHAAHDVLRYYEL